MAADFKNKDGGPGPTLFFIYTGPASSEHSRIDGKCKIALCPNSISQSFKEKE